MAWLTSTCAVALFVCDLKSLLRLSAIATSAVLATAILAGAIIALAFIAAGSSPTSPSFPCQAQHSAKPTFSTHGQKEQKSRSELKELKEPVRGIICRGIDRDDLDLNATGTLATAPRWFIARPRPARMWTRARSVLRQNCRWQGCDPYTNFKRHLPARFAALLTPASTLRVSRGQGYVLWAIYLSILVAVVSAEGAGQGVVAYDPLIPVTDQLRTPVVAGAPPLMSPSDAGQEEMKERAYIQRLQSDRVQRQGSLYVEFTPEETKQMRAGPPDVARYSKEPLPWEGIDDDASEDDGFSAPGLSFSPWADTLRYESMSDDGEGEGENEEDGEKVDRDEHRRYRKKRGCSNARGSQKKSCNQDSFLASQADMDGGAGVVDDKNLASVELQAAEVGSYVSGSPPSEEGRVLKVEAMGQFGAFSTDLDPNVRENIKEVIGPQVWDAVGDSQKDQTRTREYVEVKQDEGKDASVRGPSSSNDGGISRMELGAGINAGIAEARPRLDQIDFLGHEAEVDWLDEVEKMEMVGKANLERKEKKYHHHSISTKAMSEKHDGHGDTGGGAGGQGHEVKDRHGLKDAETDIAEDTKEPEHMRSVPPEKLLHDLQWEAEHGGLNPKHFHQGNQKMGTDPRSNNRAEEQDRDEDGIVFPEVHSDQPYSKIVYPIVPEDPDSTLGYVSYNRQGDRIMDFSMAGWNEGNTDLPDAVPDIPCLETLSPRDGADSPSDQGDDTERIQAALDRVSRKTKKLVQNKDVIPKGALALERGVYRISRPLKIRASGILFRGDPGGGSRIVCQWESRGPRYAIEVEGKTDKMLQNTRVPVMAEYTPVGSFFLALDPTYFQETGLSVGDQVVVSRIGNARWIRDIGMDDFHSDKKGLKPWKNMHAKMYRTIRYLNSQTGIVELDAPMPISISRQYGGGFVTKYKDGKIHALGIQYLDMVFPGNIGRTKEDFLDQEGRGSKDYRFSYEIFANYALRIDCAYHMYVSHITTAFFHNFVSVGTDVHHLTLDSIVHSYPDEMLSGQSAFQLSGQLVLVKDSLSQGSFHFFVDISHVMGPNVFFRSMCVNVGKPSQPMPLNFAPGEVGPHMKLCTGILVDQVVTDGPILLVNRGEMGTGHGYTSANSVVWNSRAREGILTHRAAGFQNFVIGSEDLDAMDRRPWDHHGWKEHLGSEVLPGSLYLRQLSDRLERLSKGWVA